MTVRDGRLCTAVLRGYLDIVEHLVSLGADVNKVKNDGATPLSRVAAWHGQLDTVKYLISEGAVIDKQLTNGW